MSKQKHRFRFKPRMIELTPEMLLPAVQHAEQTVLATMQAKDHVLNPIATATLLALHTKAFLVKSDTFTASDSELFDIVKAIFSLETYQTGPNFPYTKEQMIEAWREDAKREGGR